MPPLNVPRPRAGPSGVTASPVPSQPSSSSQTPSHPFVHTAIKPKPKRAQPQTASSSSTNTPASSVASLPKAPKPKKARAPRGRRKRASSEDDRDDTGQPSPSDDDDDEADDRRTLDTDEEEERREQAEQAKQVDEGPKGARAIPSSSTHPNPPPPAALDSAASPAAGPSSTPTLSATPSSSSPAPVLATKKKKKKAKKPKAPKVTAASAATSPLQPATSSSSNLERPPPAIQAQATSATSPAPVVPASDPVSTPSAAPGSSAINSTPAVVGGGSKLDWSDDIAADGSLPEIDFADLAKADLGLQVPISSSSKARHLKVTPPVSRASGSSPNPSTASSSSTRPAFGRPPFAPSPRGHRPNFAPNFQGRPEMNSYAHLPFGPGSVRPPRGPFGPGGQSFQPVNVRPNGQFVGGRPAFGPGRPSPQGRVLPSPSPSTSQPASTVSTSASPSAKPPPTATVPTAPAAPVVEKSKRALKREKVERKIQRMNEERARRFGVPAGVRPLEQASVVPPTAKTNAVASASGSTDGGAVRVKLPGGSGVGEEIKKPSARALKVKARKERERAEMDARRQAVVSGFGSGAPAAEKIVVRLPPSKVALERSVPTPTRTDSALEDVDEAHAFSELASSIHSAVTPPQSEPTHLIIEHPQPRRHPSETNVLYKSPPLPEPASLPLQAAIISPPVTIHLGPTTAIGLASAAPADSPPAVVDAPPPVMAEAVVEGEQPPRYELPPGRPHPRDDYPNRQSFSQPGQPYPAQYGQVGPGPYSAVDSAGQRMSNGRDSPNGGPGGLPALPPGFYSTESGQVFDAMGQQYVFSYPPPPPPQPFLPFHLRQQTSSPAFWSHGQPSPQFAGMSPPLSIGPDGHYNSGPGYSPTSPAFGNSSYDHQGGYPQAPYPHQSAYPQHQPYAPYPPQQYHPNGPPPQQHQHLPPGQYAPQATTFFVPRRPGFAPVRIADPHKAGGGMMASHHLPMHPKASMSFQPVSYSSYQHQDNRGGLPGMGGRSSSFDSDRTNEGYGGGGHESFTYQ